jgi:hypothetical protein
MRDHTPQKLKGAQPAWLPLAGWKPMLLSRRRTVHASTCYENNPG